MKKITYILLTFSLIVAITHRSMDGSPEKAENERPGDPWAFRIGNRAF